MSKERCVAIFRRFDDLNLLSLLALQAEIIDLDKDLHCEFRIDETTLDESQNLQQPLSKPPYMSENFKLSRESNSPQYIKLKELRNRLKEYSTQRPNLLRTLRSAKCS